MRRRKVRLLPVTVLIALAALVGSVITYDLATIDLTRLLLPVSITARLTLVLLIASGGEALLDARTAREHVSVQGVEVAHEPVQ